MSKIVKITKFKDLKGIDNDLQPIIARCQIERRKFVMLNYIINNVYEIQYKNETIGFYNSDTHKAVFTNDKEHSVVVRTITVYNNILPEIKLYRNLEKDIVIDGYGLIELIKEIGEILW